jgi:hypothetical protein
MRVYAPKDVASDDQYDRLVSDLRTIKDMPDSSKRDIVARMPLEFSPTSADMKSLNIIELSKMSRDDVLAHWGVPLSTIGGYTPTGLNSGESRKYDEAALWQNAVQFRLDSLRETIQLRLLDRLEALGMSVRLVLDVPTFDDDAPKFEMAAKAADQPLTQKERREILGLDPFGDERDDEVWLAGQRIYPPMEAPAPEGAPMGGDDVLADDTWAAADEIDEEDEV